MISFLNLVSMLITHPFTPVSILKLINSIRPNWQLIYKMPRSLLSTGATIDMSRLTPPKHNLFLLIIWEGPISLLSPWLMPTHQESDSLHLLGLTILADTKWKIYIEFITRSTAMKVDSLCCARHFFSLQNLSYIFITLPFVHVAGLSWVWR